MPKPNLQPLIRYCKADGSPAAGPQDPAVCWRIFAGKLRVRVDETKPAERLVGGRWVPTAPRSAREPGVLPPPRPA